MSTIISPNWDGIERRQSKSRRRTSDRRSYLERRYDPRQSQTSHRTLHGWIRSFTHARLGVDRRKQGEQRTLYNRRNTRPSAMLTKEELSDLLS